MQCCLVIESHVEANDYYFLKRIIRHRKDSSTPPPRSCCLLHPYSFCFMNWAFSLIYICVFDAGFMFFIFQKQSNCNDYKPNFSTKTLNEYLSLFFFFFQNNYTNWWPGEPSNFKGVEDCTVMIQKKNDEWNDTPCSPQIAHFEYCSYVCKKNR